MVLQLHVPLVYWSCSELLPSYLEQSLNINIVVPIVIVYNKPLIPSTKNKKAAHG